MWRLEVLSALVPLSADRDGGLGQVPGKQVQIVSSRTAGPADSGRFTDCVMHRPLFYMPGRSLAPRVQTVCEYLCSRPAAVLCRLKMPSSRARPESHWQAALKFCIVALRLSACSGKGCSLLGRSVSREYRQYSGIEYVQKNIYNKENKTDDGNSSHLKRVGFLAHFALILAARGDV